MIKKLLSTEQRTIDEETRTVTFCISDETEDRHRTIIKIDGWDLTDYNKNPVVLWGHKSHTDNPDMVIGTGRVYREGNKLMADATFETEDVNPLAEKVLKKIIAGTIRMTSVGFDPTEYRWGYSDLGEDPDKFYYAKQSLLEFSIVPIGSNPNALIQKSIDTIKQHMSDAERPEDIEEEQRNHKAISIAYALQ